MQAAVLFIVCLKISTMADIPKYIPVFLPLFVLALMPVIFRCQYYGMSEIEAATRASGSQVILAKLLLAGAANLVCMTVLISMEVHFQNSYGEIGQVVLYCLVPVCWGVLARTLPWLYETSALGIWIVAFLFFAFFHKGNFYHHSNEEGR